MNKYKSIVIGGGHAGIEAVVALNRLGMQPILITQKKETIGLMPCNTSIGGSAKGILVKEIDALGGVMAKAADANMLQIKILNLSKGPATWSYRSQSDKITYPKYMQNLIMNELKIPIKEDMVDELIVKNKKFVGVKTSDGTIINANYCVVTTGTYTDSKTMKGKVVKSEGPDGLKTNKTLSDSFRKLGFDLIKLKTGTPPRFKESSLNFGDFLIEPGTNDKISFSFENESTIKIKNKIDCYIAYTNPETHKVINNNWDKSYLFSKEIVGSGPRFCPSIEDKLQKFEDKDRHQIFLEKESMHSDLIYVQGLSTSLPSEVQDEFVKTIKGFENVIISKYGYAIEYDAVVPTQLKQTLETKLINGLYTAGQINGTSGYEEAAIQGLIAAINVSKKDKKEEPFILKRNEAYAGVLIDDIVTKGIIDPYRMLTSRSEYRLILRNDNAEARLLHKGRELGLISNKVWSKYEIYKKEISDVIEILKNTRVTPKDLKIEKYLESVNTNKLVCGISLYDLLRRPLVKLEELQKLNENLKNMNLSFKQIQTLETEIKFEGYILQQQRLIDKNKKYEDFKISNDFKYEDVPNLAKEAIDKLNQVKPTSIRQASNISGVNPPDITQIIYYIKKKGV